MDAFYTEYVISKTLYEVCIFTSNYYSTDTLFLWSKLHSHQSILSHRNRGFCLHYPRMSAHLVIHNKGDTSLTFSGIFFWLNTNAILSKKRYWIFMSLPFIVISVVPAVMSLYISGNAKSILLFICWINGFISASDIYNSFLIAIKPKNSVFCRGYYQVK